MRDDAGTWTVAGAILVVKLVLGAWAASVALAATSSHNRSIFGTSLTRRHTGVGVALIVLTVVTLVVAIGLFRRAPWARLATFVLEGVAILLALTRLGSVPGLALISMALSVAVIVLVAMGPREPRRLT
jgi:hypothetical protein